MGERGGQGSPGGPPIEGELVGLKVATDLALVTRGPGQGRQQICAAAKVPELMTVRSAADMAYTVNRPPNCRT